ncbi:MAG: CRISPR-associated endonuclease Cas1 [Firmicutes bacterium HGW-Firmicutes-13]|nr:MAG: CRISPR-associated endonuclease Cas1 [Firmicutes bacterium HGW-Firmicutes-13]
MNLVIDNYGSFIGKKSERLVIKENGKVVKEIPFFDLSQVTVISGGVSLSIDAIKMCMEYGVQINFLSNTGQPFAKISSPQLSATVQTRRQQMMAYMDHRGVYLARAFVSGKIKNQVNTLKYFAKHRKEARKEAYERIIQAVSKMEKLLLELDNYQGTAIDELRGQFLSVEGRASSLYWEQVAFILQGKIDFPGREHRGTVDPVNAMLNYGYGILYSQVWSAIILAGLEPFAGFMHVDRPGKPSLVLDLIEEFRQPIVDRVIIAMLSKGYNVEMEEERLSSKTRRELADKVLKRMETTDRYDKKKYKLSTVIQRQARSIATYVRGESNYRPFVGGW